MAMPGTARFFAGDRAPAVVLSIAALLALAIANSPWVDGYRALLGLPVLVRIGQFDIAKPLLL